ncbi:hypothetical protein TTHERM_00411500 (macronuclear) [Tetrahymena thermophila SB210]|uniref:Uncharacterized protein n=1 Tax=Tetrahymena thermophila (strain SB210) TaxID=312017 RepID=I7MFU2_TETTS|nr:hypothetical protein TTHERM_00411500 [Tetrahymena thermophila SB210]EAS00599.2 hypothetical protein TTHERM_00411500 [Tetrahymena thermophila SB210]|eukprot:XP_001020844.2 hypothetical protein TTHERM_00411500 [Tetrahymena thermophila SB210]
MSITSENRPFSAYNIKSLALNKTQSQYNMNRPFSALDQDTSSQKLEQSVSQRLLMNWQQVKTAKDKEGLFEEQVHLMNDLNKLKEDNFRMKERQKQIEDESQKLVDYILKIEQFVIKKKGPKIYEQQSMLIVNLKKLLEDMREEIDQKEIQVERNKKDPKFLKRREFQNTMEIYEHYLEIIKQQQLRLNIETKRNEENQNNLHFEAEDEIPQEQFEQLSPRSMRKNLINLKTNLTILQDTNDKLSVQVDQLNKQGKIKRYRLEELEEIEEEEMDEMFRLSQQIEDYRQFELEQKKAKEEFEKMQKAQPQEKNTKSYLEQIKDFHNNERNQILLNHQKEQIELQGKQIKELQEILQTLKKNDVLEKERLKNEKENLTKQLQILQKKYQKSQATLEALDNQIQQFDIKNYPQSLGQIVSISNNILQKHDTVKIVKVPKIESEQVLRIAKEINFRLRLKRIPLENAVQRLITQQIKRVGFTSLEYLTKKLRGDPFNVPDKKDALLISRFLIEDNQDNMVEVNLGAKCHYKVARSVFKFIIGNVKIYESDEDEKIVWEKCVEEISKNSAALKQYAEIYFSKRNQETNYQVSWEQIKDTFNYASNDFDNKIIDYVLIRLFEETNNITKLNFMRIFEIFSPQNWNNMDERSKNSLIFKPGILSYNLDFQHYSSDSDEGDDTSQISNTQTLTNQKNKTINTIKNTNQNQSNNNSLYSKTQEDQNTQRSKAISNITPFSTSRK